MPCGLEGDAVAAIIIIEVSDSRAGDLVPSSILCPAIGSNDMHTRRKEKAAPKDGLLKSLQI